MFYRFFMVKFIRYFSWLMYKRYCFEVVNLKERFLLTKFINELLLTIKNNYRYFMVNIVTKFNMSTPKPHSFESVMLHSGYWSDKSFKELLEVKKNKYEEYRTFVDQYKGAVVELKSIKKAEELDSKLTDKRQNREMQEIMEFYPSHFDEDSGNTRAEGIKEVKEYLNGEARTYHANCLKLKKTLDEIQKELDTKKAAAEESNNMFFPIIPMYNPVFFSIVLTIFSFCISFNLIDFNLDYFHITGVVIPTIVISTVLFVWEYYRLYTKIRKYYKLGKVIYIFCKKKIYSFYKK